MELILGAGLLLTLVEIGGGVIKVIKELANADINVPILGPIFKFITGQSLSVINVLSLLLAIPTTILAKVEFFIIVISP